jgi:hypothetical protein
MSTAMKIILGIALLGGLIAVTSRDPCPGDPESIEHKACVYDRERGFK